MIMVDEILSRYTVEFVFINTALVLATWIAMTLAVILDLWTGVDKAKALGERISSRILRNTISKMCDYWRLQVFGCIFDVFASLWFSLPYASLLCGLGVIIIEARSVLENLRSKRSPASKLPHAISMILNAKTAKEASRVLEIIKSEQKEGKNEKTKAL